MLPEGLDLYADAGAIAGSPINEGSADIVVKATDSAPVPASDTQALSLRVAAAPMQGDTDGDGLPDSWEMRYFGDLDETATGDPDGDGWSNLAEYNNGTDPSVAETMPPYLGGAQWQSVGLGGGGSQANPTIAPNNPDLMFGVCDMGGFYRSADGGRHWNMVNGSYVNGLPSYAPDDCGPEFDRQNEDIALSPSAGGLARTTDGGLTWTRVASVGVTAIAFHATDSNYAVYAGSNSRLYESTNAGATWAEEVGWRNGPNKTIREIYIDPTTPTNNATMYASTDSGVYKSTNGGANWTAVNTGLGSTNISTMDAGMKSGALVLYCLAGNHIYKTANGASSWTDVTSNLPTNSSSGAVTYSTIGVARSNADVAYAGSDFVYGPSIHKTTDGGATWTLKLTHPNSGQQPPTTTVERDWLTIALDWGWAGPPWNINVCPTDPDKLAFCEYARSWRSDNGGDHWFCCNNEETSTGSGWWRSVGFETTTCYKYVIDPRDASRHYICYTDIGFARSTDAGATWQYAATGSPWRNTMYEIACDPSVAGVIWGAASNSHDIAGWQKVGQDPNTFTGGVVKSTNWGASWSDLGHSSGLPTGAVTSILLDPTSPSNNRTIYAVVFGKGVYKSTDGGANWTAKNSGLTMGTANTNIYRIERTADGTLYCAITHRRLGDGTRLKGGLFKSTNGGDSWTLINTNYDLYYIEGFAVDPTNTNRIYAGLAHPGGGIDCASGIVYTTDGGATWHNTWTDGIAWHVVPDPELPNRVIAAVNGYGAQGAGILVSEDYGATWKKPFPFPFTMIGGIRPCYDPADSQNVYVTTYGGGVFKARLLHPSATAAAFTATPESGEMPLSVDFDSSASTGNINTWTWDFGDGALSNEADPTHVFADADTYTVTLTVEGPTGKASVSHTVEATPQYSLDSDDDGLPDAWEMEYFGDLDETAGGDYDHDGVTNGDEYAAGTDPTQADNAGPSVSSVATVPSQVRRGIDAHVTLTASASDVAHGNSVIKAAEYFVGADPGAGSGTAMSAADGAFDETAEPLTATVNTSAWTEGDRLLSVRARDAAGHWGPAAGVTVSTVDGTAPAAASDLAVTQEMSFDEIYSGSWETLGSVTPDEESTTIDLGSERTVGAIAMSAGATRTLFPKTFAISGSTDGSDWTTLTQEADFRIGRGDYLWTFESDSYRYVKIDAVPLLNRRDRHFYVQIGEHLGLPRRPAATRSAPRGGRRPTTPRTPRAGRPPSTT